MGVDYNSLSDFDFEDANMDEVTLKEIRQIQSDIVERLDRIEKLVSEYGQVENLQVPKGKAGRKKCKMYYENRLIHDSDLLHLRKEMDLTVSEINNPIGVCGLMGNLYAESGMNPLNLQNSFEKKFSLTDEEYTDAVDDNLLDFVHDGAGYGLAQWTWHGRKQKLLNLARQRKVSIGDLDTQLDYIIYELSNNYKSVLNTLKTSKDIKTCSNEVLFKYESPADQSEAMQKKRQAYSEKYLAEFGLSPVPEEEMETLKPDEVTNTTTPFLVRVADDSLPYYKEPSFKSKINGYITDHGIYTITELSENETWGKLKSGVGWISLCPVKRV